MDRFRFRVWDNEEKLYQEADADYCHITHTGELECRFTNEDGSYRYYGYIEDYIVEQCTGLKDKNGKLIYEGDIVLYGESENEIIWHKAWGDFARVSCAKKRLGLKLDYWELFDHESTKFEIIGNIHEMEVEG